VTLLQRLIGGIHHQTCGPGIVFLGAFVTFAGGALKRAPVGLSSQLESARRRVRSDQAWQDLPRLTRANRVARGFNPSGPVPSCSCAGKNLGAPAQGIALALAAASWSIRSCIAARYRGVGS
jgi:hypothetical protein